MKLAPLLAWLRPAWVRRAQTSPVARVLWLMPLPLLWCVADAFGWFVRAEQWWEDLRYFNRGVIQAPVKLVYVDIDGVSLELLGNVPWDRSHFARVCRALIERGGVKAVGIDMVFSETGVPRVVDEERWQRGNTEFAGYLWRGAPVIPAASYASGEMLDEEGRKVARPFPMVRAPGFSLEAAREPEKPEFKRRGGVMVHPPFMGLIDIHAGDVRWVPVFAPTSAKTYLTLALELALREWGVDPNEGVTIRDDHIEVRRSDGELVTTVPLADGQLVEVNWFAPWMGRDAPHASFVDVFSYAEALRSEDATERANAEEYFGQYRDAIVLIGPVDPLLQDVATTPVDRVPVPKVSVHGNLLKTLIAGRYLERPPLWGTCALVLGLTFAMATLTTATGPGARRSRLLALLTAVAYLWVANETFIAWDWVLPITAPLGAALSTSFVALVWQVVQEQKKAGRIKGLFGTYVAPALVDRMVDSGEEPKLGGVQEDITAYFSDIQSFSTFSEQLGPPQLVELMNEFLTACTDIVQAEGGTLDKYIGDAVVAMFGAPLSLEDHAYRACLGAVRVQHRVAELREKWRHEEGKWPGIVHQLQTRIGLNSGPCVVGNMGSHTRFNYTMMGDNVNLAARMESGAKQFGVYVMVTESTKRACEQHGGGGDQLVFRFLDRIIVKGRTQPVPIFELAGLRPDLTQETWDCFERFEKAQRLYLAQQWEPAIAEFEAAAALEPNRPDRLPGGKMTPSKAFIARCRHFQAHPPGAGWDGVYVMEEK